MTLLRQQEVLVTSLELITSTSQEPTAPDFGIHYRKSEIETMVTSYKEVLQDPSKISDNEALQNSRLLLTAALGYQAINALQDLTRCGNEDKNRLSEEERKNKERWVSIAIEDYDLATEYWSDGEHTVYDYAQILREVALALGSKDGVEIPFDTRNPQNTRKELAVKRTIARQLQFKLGTTKKDVEQGLKRFTVEKSPGNLKQEVDTVAVVINCGIDYTREQIDAMVDEFKEYVWEGEDPELNSGMQYLAFLIKNELGIAAYKDLLVLCEAESERNRAPTPNRVEAFKTADNKVKEAVRDYDMAAQFWDLPGRNPNEFGNMMKEITTSSFNRTMAINLRITSRDTALLQAAALRTLARQMGYKVSTMKVSNELQAIYWTIIPLPRSQTYLIDEQFEQG